MGADRKYQSQGSARNSADIKYQPPKPRNTTQSGNRGSKANYWADVTSGAVTPNTVPKRVYETVGDGKAGLAKSRFNDAVYGQSWYGGSKPDDGYEFDDWGNRGGGSYGGGGYGGGASMLNQNNVNQYLDLYAKSRPKKAKFNPLDFPEYEARDFYEFNDSPYREFEQSLNDEIAASRGTIGRTFDDLDAYYGGLDNTYGSSMYATNPGTQAAMERMLAAQGMPSDLNVQTDAEGVQADMAMGGLLASLASSQQAQIQAERGAAERDRFRANEILAREGRSLGLSNSMAEAAARSGYDQARFGYETEQDRYIYGQMLNEAMMNWQRKNQIEDANLVAGNQYVTGIPNAILQLMAMNPKLDYSAAGGLL